MSSPSDPYIDPGTGVLRNRLGITDPDELAQAEAFWTTSQLAQLYRRDGPRVAGNYDLPHLQAVHLFLFGEIYDWAGQIRTVAIAKADLFCLPHFIEPYAADVLGKLARAEHLRDRERGAFLNGLTEAFADVNALHPFREGNGRTQRAFFSQLARDAGHPLDWRGLDAQQNLIASQASLRGDLTRSGRCWTTTSPRRSPRPPPTHPTCPRSGGATAPDNEVAAIATVRPR